jgi:ribonuclease J
MLRDFAGVLPPKTQVLYGMWSGYRERREWMEAEASNAAVGGEITMCHASGHAHQQDLFNFVTALAPRKLLPVHTAHSEAFPDWHISIILPADGTVIQL